MTRRWPILMMKVHHQLLREFLAPSDVELNRNQSVLCKQRSPVSPNVFVPEEIAD